MPLIIWIVSAAAIGGVIVRPFDLPEWIFAVTGAVCLVVFGLMPPGGALSGVAAGLDVYLFLTGMMLLAEIARREGLFDTLAGYAARTANGSPKRLFMLVYIVGTIVTVFLSNDATAVVLTPAVAAVAAAANAKNPVPYLLICAFVANAASFVLPISNPANLVIFGSDMPPLVDWLSRFTLPSVLAIVSTYVVLYLTQRSELTGTLETEIAVPALSTGGLVAAFGIVVAAILLLVASAFGFELGWPTAAAGLATLVAVMIAEQSSPWPTISQVSWDTLLLVAGLFVIVEALRGTGMTTWLKDHLESFAAGDIGMASFGVGSALGFLTNLTNNLPLGLVAGGVLNEAQIPTAMTDGALIGIDIGPNLSVTGSLATILWLTALRREGLSFGALRFLKLGVLIMPVSLALTLAARLIFA